MSTIRLRFVFNRMTGKNSIEPGGSKGVENFSRYLVREIAFGYSDGLYNKLKQDIGSRMKADIQRELNHMSRMFMGSVIGIAGLNRGPTGRMTSVAPKAEGFSQSLSVSPNMFGGWTRRSSKYLRWRQRKDWKSKTERHKSDRGIDPPWFRRNSPSVLDKMKSAGTWTGAYGGFAVGINRHTSFSTSDPAARAYDGARIPGTRGGVGKVGVATIRVDAMSRITPDMLPALAGGGLGDFGANPRRSGLLSKLGSDVANRLGGDPQGNRVPFRPTIQPFLGFFLTRQVPNAVLKRITQGVDGKLLRDGTGSAGKAFGARRTAMLRDAGVIPKF